MRVFFLVTLFTLFVAGSATAQRSCASWEYGAQQLDREPALQYKREQLENFIQRQLQSPEISVASRGDGPALVIIPVVVHILYHENAENLSDERVISQLKVLNECFRRDNADSVKTPQRFAALAADCQIEFRLATSDPMRRPTNGIIRKYTPVKQWTMDDNMKSSAKAGSDGWDASQYLNIWVCNLGRTAGYASFPGDAAEKDGIVINHKTFGINKFSGYDQGKTAVHEAGHWLGLRHIWGDEYCGDDLVGDTPKQSNYTPGCPTGIRQSCSNGADGDMYMNYMDITLDNCVNLFTKGQKQRMLAGFKPGGARFSLLSSKGLLPPLTNEIPLPEAPPQWLHPQLYPNPAANMMTLDLSYDARWLGQTLTVTSMQGVVMMRITISSKIQSIPITNLRPGMYFLSGKKEDGAVIKEKFIKL